MKSSSYEVQISGSSSLIYISNFFYSIVLTGEHMPKPDDSKRDEEQKKGSPHKSSIPTKPEDTDASGDALNGTGEDNHHEK